MTDYQPPPKRPVAGRLLVSGRPILRVLAAFAVCCAALVVGGSVSGAIDDDTRYGAAAYPLAIEPAYTGEAHIGQFLVNVPALGRDIKAYCIQLGVCYRTAVSTVTLSTFLH